VEQRNANVEMQCNDGMTTLHFASAYGRLNVVQYLVGKCNVNVDAKNKGGKTAQQVATADVVREYLKRITNESESSGSSATNETTTATKHDEGTNPNAIDDTTSPSRTDDVFAAAKMGDLMASASETSGSSETNKTTTSKSETGTRHIAIDDTTCTSPNTEQYLVEQYNANIKAKDKDGITSPNALDDATIPNTIDGFENDRNALKEVFKNQAFGPVNLSFNYVEYCTGTFTSKVLGEGAYGIVYYGSDNTLGKQFAFKRIPIIVTDANMLDNILESFKRELSVRF
jgi:Ankyrin repeats (many copies)